VNDLESDLSEFTKTMHREWLQRRLPKRSMAVLLNIEGKISTLRAKPAHLVGHLPYSSNSGVIEAKRSVRKEIIVSFVLRQ
jgi:hypothetical protein